MKKNITINMFGSLYAIDEDAYELLNQYQNNMRSYFSRKEGGEETAEDIERRIAELFAELKASGVEAITIEHVQDIIKRIGNPEQLDDQEERCGTEEEEAPAKEENKNNVHKKLFRNPDDKMLGGVCSGLACFFGIDSLWIRLLMILLTWFSAGIMLVAYLVLWILVPEACTPEDRLRMQGRPVNMETLRDEIMEGARKAGQYATAPETKKTARGCLNCLFDIAVIVFKGCFFACLCGALLILGIFLLFALIWFFLYLFSAFSGNVWEEISGSSADQAFFDALTHGRIDQTPYWVTLVSAVTLLSLSLYIGIHSLLRILNRVQPMHLSKRLVLAAAWLVFAAVFTASAIQSSAAYNHYVDEYIQERNRQFDEKEKKKQLDYLAQEGWTVVRHENCNGYVKQGEHYNGNRDARYIDAWSNSPYMEYELEHTAHVAPGTYRLVAAARTDGNGCEIFAICGNVKQMADVPVYGNTGGGIWQEARQQQQNSKTASAAWKKIAEANSGNGFGWSRIEIDSLVAHDGIIRYGVTNTRNGKWDGSWFSATDFKLEQTGKLP